MLIIGLGLLYATHLQAPLLKVSVDAREARFGLIHTKETIPVKPGAVTLSYPKWLPGEHTPGGPLGQMINLSFAAGSQSLSWKRDDVEMYQFHVTVPEGVSSIEVNFDSGGQTGSDFTPFLARLDWNAYLLYPAGLNSDDIQVAGDVTLPDGWRMATPLLKEPSTLSRVEFPTVSLTEFIDSPAIAGKFFNRVVLTPTEEADIVGDTAASIDMPKEEADRLRALIAEAYAAFGAKHYRKYDFLLSFSDIGAFSGLEHHECSEDGMSLNGISAASRMGYLLSHEYTHSWNGKYRRPAGIATPNYDVPMKDELLWVYEGMTEFWGEVLATRSGHFAPEEFRDDLARLSATLQHRAGRTWRSVEDTAVGVQVRGDAAWTESRRVSDYYYEGVFIWLEVDSIIRQQTQGQKSIDDFSKLFHGGQSGGPEVKPYTFADIVTALNIVAPYDWASLLSSRAQTLQPQLSTAGFENEGWKLVYNETPARPTRDWARGNPKPDNDSYYTIGAHIGSDGEITDLVMTMPAGVAGLRPGMKVVGVNGVAFSDDRMLEVLKSKVELDIETSYGGELKTFHVPYKDGLKYAHLVRDESKPDTLSELIKAHSKP